MLSALLILLAPLPADYHHVLLMGRHDRGPHFAELRYEGNNPHFRGPRRADGTWRQSGAQIAARWREFVAATRQTYVLRDSLFSQQDHPVGHDAHALLLPPNWVSVAVDFAERGEVPPPFVPPPIDDDAAWAELATPKDLFGRFPASETLHRYAVAPRAEFLRRTPTARRNIARLAEMANSLRGAPDEVAARGAEIIADSDVTYFGERLRAQHVVPIFVENPTAHELEEGKGMDVPALGLRPSAVERARDAVYRRRLRDGDLALERYDLSKPADRQRALGLLARLIPATEPEGYAVHLWVTGPLDPKAKLKGEDAAKYIEAFGREVAQAPIAAARLRYVSKPVVELPAGDRAAFEAAAKRYRALGLPLSVLLDSKRFAELIGVAAK